MNNGDLKPILRSIGWRYLLRHGWQTFLMVLGISLGVAVVVSIDLANASSARAFDLSAASVAGRATHQITGGPQGLDESLYARLKSDGVIQDSAPVISEYVTSPQLGGQPLQLLGIDPFAEKPFRDYLGGRSAPSVDQLAAFLTRPGAVLISAGNAARYKLQTGSRLSLDVGGRAQDAFVAGLLEPSDRLAQRTLDGLIVADVSTAQELTGRLGKLDRIDLILPTGPGDPVKELAARLPRGAALSPASARQGSIEQMTAAFHTNLTALSMLALLVGLFLIYNSMTFSVVQRRPLFGTLRCLGVTRREVFSIVAGEALVIGIVGAGVGIGLGLLLGRETVQMVTQTVNDLYFTTTVRDVGIPVESLAKGALLGILATLLTAIPPAWEAASVLPRAALSRAGLETKTRRAVGRLAIPGAALIAAGALVFTIPTRNLVVGFSGTFAVIVGFAMLSALVMVAFLRGIFPVSSKVFGMLGRMAPRNLVNALSRTSIAVAALMVAVAVTIGVSLMIDSFRFTVMAWLAQTLQSDVYVSAPGFTETTALTVIDPAVIEAISRAPGVARTDLLRVTNVTSPKGPVNLSASDNPGTGFERLYLSRDLSPEATWQAMQNGAVIVSEPLANRLGIPRRGGSLVLDTPQGQKTFPVVGIFYDYASSQGTAVMNLAVYRRIWQDPSVTAIGLRLAPGARPDAVAQAVQDLPAVRQARQQLIVRPNKALREDVMTVFDRTFAITGALNVLATVVAFIGVLSSLLLLQLEKQREVGILRAIGLTVRQLWGLVMLETGLMGAAAGLLAMPAGYALSLILVFIINRRSFGWTLQMSVRPEHFASALLVAIAAALLAGIYPAYKLGRMAAAEAIRFE